MIGTVGFSPLDAQKLKHPHFEIWLPNRSDAMAQWAYVGDSRAQLVVRNGSLVYRPVGESGAYPQWVCDLKGEAGVYLIRELETCGIRTIPITETGG